MAEYKVVERFISINGEGKRAGQLAVFIRFQGCNLKCSYCDTLWANEAACPYTLMRTEQLIDYVLSTKVKNVTLTGGEPLLQENIKELLLAFAELDIRVEIETNGSVDLKPFADIANPPSFTMDYKLPDSGMEEKMNLANLEILKMKDTLKFVAASLKDLEKAKDIIAKYDLVNRCNVYISSVFGKIDYQEIVAFMIENHLNDVNFQLQLHKFIWDPQERGV